MLSRYHRQTVKMSFEKSFRAIAAKNHVGHKDGVFFYFGCITDQKRCLDYARAKAIITLNFKCLYIQWFAYMDVIGKDCL